MLEESNRVSVLYEGPLVHKNNPMSNLPSETKLVCHANHAHTLLGEAYYRF